MINGSHVHRLLVHVHMYIMYFLSVVLVLGKDVIRLCSYRVKSEGSHICKSIVQLGQLYFAYAIKKDLPFAYY